jgi:exodeoxyribonuclease V alpha subunit
VTAVQPNAPITLEGQIERITYRSADSHYMIARFRPSGQSAVITVLGHIPEPGPGESLRLSGCWQTHPRYGQQFNISGFELLLPAGVEQIRRYLASGLIKGIGAKTAERLVCHFQAETLDIIEKEPDRLAEVRGIGLETARRIGAAWQAHHQVRTLMQFLQANEVQSVHAMRIYKQYGPDALEIVRNHPDRLAVDIPRVGFHIYAALVRHCAQPLDEVRHARVCIRFLLDEATEEGHTCVLRDILVQRCTTAFDLDYHAVLEALEQSVVEERTVICPQAPGSPVYLPPLYAAEQRIAQRLRAMLSITVPTPPIDPGQIMATVVKRLAIQLSEAQRQVVQSVFNSRVVIITGGPGTGKTTLIRAIVAVFEAMGKTFLLAAPTGRAARRMAEVTGRPAATLHKLLGYNLAEACFERDQDDPLDTQALVVDEVSMIDTLLMGSMLDALPLQACLILVGDVFQLPSVGPGNVLADLIASERVCTFELQEVFRQAAQSPIIANAHRVRHGQMPELLPIAGEAPLTPFAFIERNGLDDVARTIVELCTRRIPDQLGVDGTRDVQVLTPMHKSVVGTVHLNRLLQKALNPHAALDASFGGRFFLKDKVMHLRNNYQKEVFNGEIGTVESLERGESRLVVAYDGRRITYDEADLDELALAYAISVHKSQGSEYPIIVLPLVTQHYVMLQRNLLYTALTRARQMVVLVGSAKAVRVAVQADQPCRRQSLLQWRILNGDRL